MHGHSSGDDGLARERRPDSNSAAPTTVLDAAVVSYDDRPDRLTIYPADDADDRRLTAWLSANASAFADLDERR